MSLRNNLLKTSLTMWKKNLIWFKHERDNIITLCVTNWKTIRSIYFFDTFSTDLLFIIRVKFFSLYHVFCNQVNEYRQIVSALNRLSVEYNHLWYRQIVSALNRLSVEYSHLWYRQVSALNTTSLISSSLLSMLLISEHQTNFFFSASDKFFVRQVLCQCQCIWSTSIRQLLRFFFVSVFNQCVLNKLFVNASNKLFVSVSNKFFVSASDKLFVSASDKFFVSALNKSFVNHQITFFESAIIKQVSFEFAIIRQVFLEFAIIKQVFSSQQSSNKFFRVNIFQ